MVRGLLSLFLCFLRISGGCFCLVGWLGGWFIGCLVGCLVGSLGVLFLERNQLQCLYVLPDGAPNITGFSPLALLKFRQNVHSVLGCENKKKKKPTKTKPCCLQRQFLPVQNSDSNLAILPIKQLKGALLHSSLLTAGV